MDNPKISQVSLHDDSPTGINSKVHGANIDALAFNISLIASKNPALALKIFELYNEAHQISPDDTPHPEEDYSISLEKLKDIFK